MAKLSYYTETKKRCIVVVTRDAYGLPPKQCQEQASRGDTMCLYHKHLAKRNTPAVAVR